MPRVGTAASVLSLVDGAKSRLYVKLTDLSDANLEKHLAAAAKRGVDVHVYLVEPKPADGQTVLNAESLEADGVDTFVDRSDRVAGATAVADDQELVSGKVVKNAAQADAAASAFDAAAVEKTGGPPSLLPEKVKLLGMPEATGAEIAAALGAAKKSIDLEVYQLQDPAINAALIAAQKRGVKVRVMLEPRTVGSANYDLEVKKLSAAGIEVKATPPRFDGSHNVDHAKFMVVDGQELLFGTGNLVRSGLGGNVAGEFDNRDLWIEDGRAKSVSEGRSLFEADWNRQDTSALRFQNLVLTPDNADQRILDLVGGAKKRCYVYNQSLSDPKVIAALVAAKARGVDVRVLLGYQPGFGGQPPKNDAALKQLQRAGIRADYYTRNYLHGKAIVADDRAFVGSQNFTNGGLGANRELGEILDDAGVVSQVAALFLGDEAHPKP